MLNRRHFFQASAGFLSAMGLARTASAAPALPASVVDEVVPSAENPILLNFNENALGMAPSAERAVVESLKFASRYPDDYSDALVADIAALYGLKPENVTLGVGSSETIQAVIEAQVEAARHAGRRVQLLEPVPTFGIAAGYAEELHVPVKDVVLNRETLAIDVAKLKAEAEAFDGVSIVYFCNPNNPTGTITPKSELSGWIRECAQKKAPVFFLVDEAYAEFVDDPAFESGVELIKEGLENLVVTRTFSKLYALAGLRIGYGLAVPSTLKACEAFASVDNTSLTAAVAASATIKDKAYLELSLESTKLSREIVVKALKELGIRYLPSQANFIFHEVKGETSDYQKKMAEAHIKVGRAFPPFTNWSRLTLGTPGEMKAFVKVLKDFRSKGLI